MGRTVRNILPDLERCAKETADINNRRHGRVHVEETKCSLGMIEDISRSGMRIRTKERLRPCIKPIGLRIETPAGKTVLPCRVVWAEKAGFRKWLIGIEYADLTKEQQTMLNHLARTVSTNLSLGKHAVNTKRAG